ncbi:MAG TPA: FtsX-like permease family protein [Vicinamibacterales bacterium]|nr:FtsX-like permease family protein [Vicinamibacterales bacterium]
MRALTRKLLRDLWSVKGQALAIGLVMAAGVAMCLAYLSTFHSLRYTQRAYYDRYRFADVFVSVKRAPLGLQDRIAAIPGIARAVPRVVVDVTLDVEGLTEPATGRLVSIEVPARPTLNDIFLRRGRWPSLGRPDEVIVSEAFATAHGLGPGDSVGAIINGRRRELQIVGIGLSPEYLYSIRPGELIPDDARFGIFWMERRGLASAFDMEGAFNDLAIRLRPGANERDVIVRLDTLLKPYGAFGAIPRALQTSHWYIDNELRQLQTVGLVIPIVFLGVAAFLLNVVLTRIVSVQREQIAALKALGYTKRELGLHYMQWGLVIALTGAVLGTAFGAWLGSSMTSIYNDFFRFPQLLYELPPSLVVVGALVSVVAALLGASAAVTRAVRLPPAEAMRPEPPASYRETLLERIGLKRWLPQVGRMVLRNLSRQPVRALTSIVGVSLATAMLVLGTFILDAIDVLLDSQFFVIQRQDLTVSFVEPVSGRALHELKRLPGVLDVEPTRAVAARMRHGPRWRHVTIQGIVQRPRLQRVVDAGRGPLELPSSGLVLSTKLAELLEAEPGDRILVEVLEGRRPIVEVPVNGLVEEYMGTAAYMQLEALHDLMREGPSLSGAALQVDAREAASLYERLKRTPRVAGVSLKRSTIESFEKTMDETMHIMVFFNVLFAGVIAFGVVYNTARISLSERSRELASLRVLGFTRAEISTILLGELGVVTVVAIPAGLVLGYLSAGLLIAAFNTELFRFPLVISPATYAYAALAVLAATALSAAVVRRRLDHLDLVAVLKTKE